MPDFERGKWGWAVVHQKDGGTDIYRRASTVASYLDDKSNLIDWKAAMTCFGVVRSEAMIANFRMLNWHDDKPRIRELVKKAAVAGGAEDAADMGTAFHRLVEAHHKREQLDEDLISDEFKAALKGYIELLAELKLTAVGSEVRVVNDTHRIAGTADLILRAETDIETPFGTIAAGQALIADVKTGSVSDYSGMSMGMQLGIYSHSTPYDAGRNVRTSWEGIGELNPAIGLIFKVDLKAGTTTPWWLNLDEAYEFVDLAMQVSASRTRGRKLIAQGGTAAAAEKPAAPAKPAAKEVRDAIKAAEDLNALDDVGTRYGKFFTDAQQRMFTERKEAFLAADGIGDDTGEAPTRDEIRTALGQADSVAELEAVRERYADHLSDEQVEAIAERIAGYQFDAAATSEPEPVDDYGPEHAKRVAAESRNVGELRSAYVTFSRNNAPAEVLSILASRAASLSEGG